VVVVEDRQDVLEYIPKDERDAIPLEDFAWPEQRKYPVDTQDHLDSIPTLIGHAPDAMQPNIKARAISIAKRKGLTIPSAWQDDTKESYEATPTPKARIASFKTKWLEDGAKSRNGRVYPRDAVEKLVQSAQVALSNPNHPDPLLCYTSHAAADDDRSREIAGKVTKVWKQGNEAWAQIDIPDTTSGRDVAVLAKHGYLRTSLRASGAELSIDRESGIPKVGGDHLTFRGIDLTTTPGIETVTVQDVVMESSKQATLSEIFEFDPTTRIVEEQAMEIREDGDNTIPTMASGESPYVDDSPTTSSQSQGHYPVPPVQDVNNGLPSNDAANNVVQMVHDRAAAALRLSCCPDGMQESGAELSARNKGHLQAIHDSAAKHLGKNCAPAAASTQVEDGDGDNDMDAQEAHMTEEEARKLLEAKGYKMERPKTREELLKEELDAKLAEMQKSFEAKLQERTPAPSEPEPQRKSKVEGSNVSESGAQQRKKSNVYYNGKYVQEEINQADWTRLVDRSDPFLYEMAEKGVNLGTLIKEFQELYVVQEFDRLGWPDRRLEDQLAAMPRMR
jgi:hypothetical protein